MRVRDRTVCDVNGDGAYRDVTGDGFVTNANVSAFCSNQPASARSERTDLFDFVGDEVVS